jgi:predicted alpha/beta hydrolase family esterase
VQKLIVPGWGNSGPAHWQSLWEQQDPDHVRVQQDDWDNPDLAGWVARLDEAVAVCPEPPIIIAHSLGCTTVAHWVARTGGAPVHAALLVAPPDVDRLDEPALFGFRNVPRVKLPFPSLVVGSLTDHYMTASRAAEFAEAWGARYVNAGEEGHINVAAGRGPWPEGERLLKELLDSV